MATNPALELTKGVAALNALAARDLAALWRSVTNAAEAEVALRDILPRLIDTYGLAAGTLAADWYDDQRNKVGAKKRFRAIPADIKDSGSQALIGWATSTATDIPSLQSLIEGGTQRRIANFSRLTVSGSSIEDPAARGWYRIGAGSSCEFCVMLIDRGAVYSESSVDFASHDHCNCGASPAWDDERVIETRPYEPSDRFRSQEARDSANQRVREWLRDNPQRG